MKLPNYEQAVIPKAKITDYLLSLSHQMGTVRLYSSLVSALQSKLGKFWPKLCAAMQPVMRLLKLNLLLSGHDM
jgi:hypothetical protein